MQGVNVERQFAIEQCRSGQPHQLAGTARTDQGRERIVPELPLHARTNRERLPFVDIFKLIGQPVASGRPVVLQHGLEAIGGIEPELVTERQVSARAVLRGTPEVLGTHFHVRRGKGSQIKLASRTQPEPVQFERFFRLCQDAQHSFDRRLSPLRHVLAQRRHVSRLPFRVLSRQIGVIQGHVVLAEPGIGFG